MRSEDRKYRCFFDWYFDAEESASRSGEKIIWREATRDNVDCIMDQLFAQEWLEQREE